MDDHDQARKTSESFLRGPTVIEWIVIAGVVLVIAALFLPNVDEGSGEARQRLGAKNAANREP